MKKHVLYCNPSNGRLNFEKPFDIKNLPVKLKKYGRVKITFEKYSELKSLKQLGYYYGGILPFLEKELYADTGLVKDDWHQELKTRFGIKKKDLTGQFSIIKSLRNYTVKEMSDFIQKILDWCMHFLGLIIPPKNVIAEYI